jgi:hypothetical protein
MDAHDSLPVGPALFLSSASPLDTRWREAYGEAPALDPFGLLALGSAVDESP